MLRNSYLPLLLAVAACSPQAPKISAHDAWARETGSADSAAAYVTIDNAGGADRLVGVQSTIGMAMVHESMMEGGIARMRPVDPNEGLTVPSNGKLLLAPNGAHVMIMRLRKPLRAGDRFDLTLTFAKSKPERVTVAVKAAAR